LSAEATLRVAFEAGLINSTRIVVAKLLMLSQLAESEQFVFVGKDFLVASTEIAHGFAMLTLDMSVEIWPAETCNITIIVGAVVAEKECCVFSDYVLFVLDSEVVIRPNEIFLVEVFEALVRVVSENNEG
jgi:hypothetical protein